MPKGGSGSFSGILSMNKRNLILAAAIFVLVVIGFFAKQQKEKIVSLLPESVQRTISNGLTSGSAKNPSSSPKGSSGSDPQFRTWVAKESGQVERSDSQPKATEADLRVKAESLTNDQVLILKEIAQREIGSANEKIFSYYLMAIGNSAARGALVDLLKQDIPSPIDKDPHSLDSLKATQEKSRRIMAVDLCAIDARHDKKARESLTAMAQEALPLEVREYAGKKLKELPDSL